VKRRHLRSSIDRTLPSNSQPPASQCLPLM
jgi:hypothetical protein